MAKKNELVPAEKLLSIARDRDIALLKQMFTLDGPKKSAEGFGATRGDEGFSEYKMGRAWRSDKEGHSSMTFRFPYMGAQELRVLHALIAAAMGALPSSCERYHYTRMDMDDRAKEAWQRLQVNKLPAPKPRSEDREGPRGIGEHIVVLSMSRRQLLRILGVRNYPEGSIAGLMRSLDMLSETSFAVMTKGGLWAKTRLIGNITVSETDRMVIVLNPRSAAATMRLAGSYTLYSIDEMRQIKGDAALLLHSSLSAFVNAGGTTQIGMENIMSRLWINKPNGSDRRTKEAMRQRRRTVYKAIEELSQLGWSFDESGQPNVLKVCRPSLPREAARQKPLPFDGALLGDIRSLLDVAED